MVFAGFVLSMAALVGLLSSWFSGGAPARIRIGAPDDSGGLLLHYILHEKRYAKAELRHTFEAYPLKDCCTSTSEWAFSANQLDLAVMCPDAANRLIGKDSRFTIVGPCVVNSDVLVMKPGAAPRRIGVTQKRDYQERLVENRFGPGCAAVPMLTAALPYALERNFVDGVVVDILKGLAMVGGKAPASSGEKDMTTYVLVVKRGFNTTDLYREFMETLAGAAAELNDIRALIPEVEAYKGMQWTNRETEAWRTSKVRFVSPRKPGM